MLFAESTATRSPGCDPEIQESGRDLTHERVVLAVGQAAVTLHDPVHVAPALRERDEVAHRPEPLAVDLQRYSEHVFDDDLEGTTGPRQRFAGVSHRTQESDAARSCCATSKLHSSAWVLTGPSLLWALWPCWNAGLFTQAWKSSSDRHRV